AALTPALAPRSASAFIPPLLCDSTTRAAINVAAGPAVSALAQEVLRSMLFHQLKFIALSFLFLGAVATGAGFLTHSLAMKDEPKRSPVDAQPKLATKPADAPPGRMCVAGRVL